MSAQEFFGRKPISTSRSSMLRKAVVHFEGRKPPFRVKKGDLAAMLNLLAEEKDLTADEGYETWLAIKEDRTLPRKAARLPSVWRYATSGPRRMFSRSEQRFEVQRSLAKKKEKAREKRRRAAPISEWTFTVFPQQPQPNDSSLQERTAEPIESPTSGRQVTETEYSDAESHTEWPGIIDEPPALTIPLSDALNIHNGPEPLIPASEDSESKQPICTVCLDEIMPINMPRRRITSICNHEPDICRACLTSSIVAQFRDKMWDQIDCPTCGARLTYEDVKLFADSSVFGRYDNHAFEACLVGSHFQRCRHEGCNSGQHCFPEDDSYIICTECHGRTCISCDVVWHPDESCADVSAKRAEDSTRNASERATQEYVDTKTKNCPKCNVPGEKDSGCDHMTCPRCKHQYCWLCFADYRPIRARGNAAHHNTCYYHTNNLPGAPGHDAWLLANPGGVPS